MRTYLYALLGILWPTLVCAVPATVTWIDNSTNETGFGIERKLGTAAFTEVGKVAANIVTYNDDIAPGNVCYRIYSFNAAGRLPTYSNEACVTVPALPAVPSGARVTMRVTRSIQTEGTVTGESSTP